MNRLNTEQQIKEACKKYGARTVYNAAFAQMAGDAGKALRDVGLTPGPTLGEAYQITNVSYDLMSYKEQREDYNQAVVDSKKITRR